MNYRIEYGGEKYYLAEDESSVQVVFRLRAGKYPGLVTLQSNHGSVTLNLSEHVQFALRGEQFPSGEPAAAVVF